MSIFLWVLQTLLAVHTLMGAVWKFSNSEQTVPSLQAIPHVAWLGLGVFELFLGVALVLPIVHRPLAILAPLAALGIAAIMFLYVALHFLSGDTNHGQVVYWLVVAAVSGFIAFGRLVLSPVG